MNYHFCFYAVVKGADNKNIFHLHCNDYFYLCCGARVKRKNSCSIFQYRLLSVAGVGTDTGCNTDQSSFCISALNANLALAAISNELPTFCARYNSNKYRLVLDMFLDYVLRWLAGNFIIDRFSLKRIYIYLS